MNFNDIFEELNLSIDQRVINHRNNFYKIITNRYYNLLPTLIQYSVGNSNTLKIDIDYYTLEVLLRFYGNAVIGLDKFNVLRLLGTNLNNTNGENVLFKRSSKNLKIQYLYNVLPQQSYKEVNAIDNYKTGNCVVIYNNLYNGYSDKALIEYYCQELTEINLSRFSLILQAKLNTFIKGEIGDETINQIITKIYNGSPFLKLGKSFDVEEDIIHFDNNSSELLLSLKNEYNNKLSEFNNLLGINSSFKEKESGISNIELNGNVNFINANANIYILSRNEALKQLYKRFGVEIVASYRDKGVMENEDNN
jgi:upper collar protein|nr:MAG TPA: upper collar protein [Caudoviricetes sp.]